MKLIWKTNDRNSLDVKETNWRKRETRIRCTSENLCSVANERY